MTRQKRNGIQFCRVLINHFKIYVMNSSLSVVADSTEYKHAMRHLAGATCVVTAEHLGQKSGLTVTSVTSVAAEPPELLVCINQTTSAWPLIEKSGCFGVNVIAQAQTEVALRFAGVGGVKGAERYQNACWTQHKGIWLLDEASAVFACRVTEVIIRHSHALVLGAVEYVRYAEPTQEPLIYWQGQFGTFQE